MVSVDILVKGLFKEVGLPRFGQQHLGISPGGAMDCFSFQTGNKLLGNAFDETALEIIIAPRLRFQVDCWFTLTGARYDTIVLKRDGNGRKDQAIEHAAVYQAKAGDLLEFGNKTIGFRTYLCCREKKFVGTELTGKRRNDLEQVYQWMDKDGTIRVVPGPELNYLDDSEWFTNSYWKLTSEFNEMGFRLTGSLRLPAISLTNMISEAVADGTIQLTPTGPIVLLRRRQTVGGYPRIFNVISADIDLLGQYYPNQIIRFKRVTMDEARAIYQSQQTALQNCC